MYLNPEVTFRSRRACRSASLALAAAWLLTACSLSAPFRTSPATPEVLPRISNAVPAVAAAAPPPAEPPPVPAQPANSDPQPQTGPLPRVLSYAERVRSMPAAELASEAARLSAPGESSVPASQMQLALVLGQTRQLPDLVRAQELANRVLANTSAEAQPLHALARVLAFRFGEQRRLEDLLDKERQQSRELQKKLDQTNERLEALKAIERSLTTRPPPVPPVAAPAAADGSAPATSAAPARRRPSAP